MKFNWGIGITIAIIAFMGFILFMVFQATSTSQDLQAEDYYAQEIGYQKKIDALRRGDKYADDLKINQDEGNITIDIPTDLKTDDGNLTVELLRPNDADLDREIIIPTSDPNISKENLISGNYKVTFNWIENSENHAAQLDLTVQK